MAGQFWPHGPASKASRTAKASFGIFGPVDAAQRPCDRLSVYVPALNVSTQTASRLLCPASEMVEAILDGRDEGGVALSELLEPFPGDWMRQKDHLPAP